MTAAAPTPTDELLVLAEELASLKERFGKVEDEFSTQARPLEAAATALQAALAGLTTLREHVLENDLAKLSARVETQRQTIDEQLSAIVADLKQSDTALATRAGEVATNLGSEVSALRTELGRIVTQFGAEISRVQLAAREEVTKLAAVPGPQGPAGASLTPAGKWDAAKPGGYPRNAIVSFLGGSFVSNVDGNTEKPGPKAKNWTTLVERTGGGLGDTGSSYEPASLATLTDGATVAWNLLQPAAKLTLGGNRTLTVSNLRAGGTYILHVIQSAGSNTLTWPASVKWPGNTAPTLTTTAAYRDIFTFTSDGTYLFGSYVQNYAV